MPESAGKSPSSLSERARAFIAAPRFAVVSTIEPDGSPLQAVVWYLLDGDDLVFNSAVGRRWPANLLRDRRAALTVVDGYAYVELRGRVTVDEDPEHGLEVISALARRYHPDDPEKVRGQIEVFRTQQRVTFRLAAKRVLEHFE